MICDGFRTHETLEILEFCFENNIILCHLLSHNSYKLQPCDVRVFAFLKAAYRDQAERLLRGGTSTVSKEHFTSLYSLARERAFMKRNITASWAASGLFPFNLDRVFRHTPKPPAQLTAPEAAGMQVGICLSFDGSELRSSTTTGIPDGFSRRYCAPEIAAQRLGPRNEKTDIFSLGCVYAEILTTLEHQMLPQSLLTSCYADNIENTLRSLGQAPFLAEGSWISTACIQMLDRVNGARPAAEDIANCFYRSEALSWRGISFGRCMLGSDFVCKQCAPLITERQLSNRKFDELLQDQTTKLLSILQTCWTGNFRHVGMDVIPFYTRCFDLVATLSRHLYN